MGSKPNKFELAVREAWPAEADRILAIIRGEVWRDHPAVVAWAAQCFNDPRAGEGKAECQLCAINAEIDGCGVEAIRGRFVDRYSQDIQAEYINFGDPYDRTILYDRERRTWRVTSWGDWVEEFGDQREVA